MQQPHLSNPPENRGCTAVYVHYLERSLFKIMNMQSLIVVLKCHSNVEIPCYYEIVQSVYDCCGVFFHKFK